MVYYKKLLHLLSTYFVLVSGLNNECDSRECPRICPHFPAPEYRVEQCWLHDLWPAYLQRPLDEPVLDLILC